MGQPRYPRGQVKGHKERKESESKVDGATSQSSAKRMPEANTVGQEGKEGPQSGSSGNAASVGRCSADGAEGGGIDEPVPTIRSGAGMRPECGASATPLRSEAVQEFISRMVRQGQFSVGYMRRTQNKEFVEKALARGAMENGHGSATLPAWPGKGSQGEERIRERGGECRSSSADEGEQVRDTR
jgi:hypothetical protein